MTVVGVTLVEALVALSVVSILLVLATPAFSKMLAQMRLNQATDSLWLAMMQAKSEAIKRNSRVVVCKSSNGGNCTKSGRWEQGWIIFQDTNNSATLDSEEELIYRHLDALPAVTISSNTHVNHYVSFSAWGTTKMLSGAFQAGTFTLCLTNGQGDEARQVVINSVGRVRTGKASKSLCLASN